MISQEIQIAVACILCLIGGYILGMLDYKKMIDRDSSHHQRGKK